jgi:hypothetical protein
MQSQDLFFDLFHFVQITPTSMSLTASSEVRRELVSPFNTFAAVERSQIWHQRRSFLIFLSASGHLGLDISPPHEKSPSHLISSSPPLPSSLEMLLGASDLTRMVTEFLPFDH